MEKLHFDDGFDPEAENKSFKTIRKYAIVISDIKFFLAKFLLKPVNYHKE